MFINDICIGVLTKCNWSCKYCIASNSNPIDEDVIYDKLYPVRHKLRTLWVSGGEPGLLSEKFWSKLLDSIDFNLRICTNGTFISNGLYDKFKNRIIEVVVHCVRELDDDIDETVLDAIRTDSKIRVNIVVHKYNTSLVKEFLLKYSDIKFEINFTDITFAKLTDANYMYAIDREAALAIVKQLGSLPAYVGKLNNIMRALVVDDFTYLNRWSDKNYAISIF
jgi:organic radical activating enzyme